MSKDTNRSPLHIQLAEQIKSAINHGEWTVTLPGTRTLAERYKVSRITVRSALKLLEEQGILHPVKHSKSREIRAQRDRAPQKKKHRRLLIIQQKAVVPDSDYTSLDMDMQHLWEENEGSTVSVKVDYASNTRPDAKLRELIERHAIDAILLITPTAPWVIAASHLCPTYCNGGTTSAGVEISLSGYSRLMEFERVLLHLKSLGHRRILAPVSYTGRHIRDTLIKVLKKVFPEPLTAGKIEDFCPHFSVDSPDTWRGYWQREFARLQPTAVLVLHHTHHASCLGYCAENGIKIPRDISIISLDYSSTLEWFSPVPAMMRYPNKKAVAHFAHWIKGDLKPIGIKTLPLTLLPGESLAPAALVSDS